MSLPTTTLASAVDRDDNEIYLASTSGVRVNTILSCGVEVMRVVGLGAVGVGGVVRVLRGVEGTAAVAHESGATVNIGTAADFTVVPVNAIIQGTTPDRTTTVVAQDTTATTNTTTTPIASVTS